MNPCPKAFLATEQRIPGLGNGVLQDILWTARIHPKLHKCALARSHCPDNHLMLLSAGIDIEDSLTQLEVRIV